MTDLDQTPDLDAILPPALTYQRWPLDRLLQDPHNARGHPDRNLAELRASLKRWGQRLPVVVRHGQLVGGNATALVAEELGWTHLDVVIADDLSKGEAERLAVALNRTAELAVWNHQTLAETLVSFDGDLDGTGFTPDELGDLLTLGQEPQPDTSPQLGDHLEYRIVVDCADEQDQARLVQQFQADGITCRAVIT